MAKYSWNEIDEFNLDYEEHYCAFIDILGYKNKSDDFFNGKYNLFGRYERALSQSMETLNSITKSKLIDTRLLKIKFFSDSIIVTHKKTENIENSVCLMLMFCNVLSSNLSYERLFVRGGISIGKHIEKDDPKYNTSFLSSKSLEDAYQLESKQAIYPRILIDEKIITSLSALFNDLIIKNDGFHILHFAKTFINSCDIEKHQDVIGLEINSIYNIYMSEKDERVKEKYQWLLSYYFWTLTKTPGIDICRFRKYDIGNKNRFNEVKFP